MLNIIRRLFTIGRIAPNSIGGLNHVLIDNYEPNIHDIMVDHKADQYLVFLPASNATLNR